VCARTHVKIIRKKIHQGIGSNKPKILLDKMSVLRLLWFREYRDE